MYGSLQLKKINANKKNTQQGGKLGFSKTFLTQLI